MNDLFFQTPWWFPTAFVAAGLALFFTGNSRTNSGLRNAGLALAVLGLLIAGLSYVVDTDKEKVTKRAYQLVQSAGDCKWEEVEPILSSDVQFDFEGRHYGNREILLQSARISAQTIGLHAAHITSFTPHESGSTITATMRVLSEQDKVGISSFPSDWTLKWRKENGQWVLTDMRLEPLENVGTGQAQKYLP